MAKIRRVIRKIRPALYQPFDDQLWPVLVALLVLGGFIMGTILAYLRFDNPHWYANAITWLMITPLIIAGIALAMAFVNNQVFRRSMQLAVVLGLLFHVVLFVVSLRVEIFSRVMDVLLARNTQTEQRLPVTIPDYHQAWDRERPQQDFERPVETETPQPPQEIEEVQREETQETPTPEPATKAVPESEQAVRPTAIARQPAAETVPRFSPQQSQLSRRVNQVQPSPPTAVAATSVPEAVQTRRSNVQAQESSIERQPTENPARRQLVAAPEPSVVNPQTATALARRETEQTPEQQSSSRPTINRQANRALQVPRTEMAISDAPAVPARTNPEELLPHTTLAQKQETASPDRTQPPAEPVPQTQTSVAAEPQRQQLRTESRPTVAETPVSVPNRRTRTTPRPDLVTAAAEVTPTDSPAPTRTETTPLAAAPSNIRRSTTQANIERPSMPVASQADVSPPTTPLARQPTREPSAPPSATVAQNQAAAPVRRPQTAFRPTPSTTAEQVAAASTPRANPAAVSPQPQSGSLVRRETRVDVQRSSTAEPVVAAAVSPSASRPQAMQTPSQEPAAPPLASALPRQPTASRAPAPAPTAVAAIATPAAPPATAAPAAEPVAAATQATRQAAGETRAAPAAVQVASTEPSVAAPPTPQLARRQAAPSTVAEAASAPAATPRRQTAAAAIAPNAVAQATQAPAVTTTPGPTGPTPTAAARVERALSTGDTVAARAGADLPTAPSASTPAETGASIATRRPLGEAAPTVASSPVSTSARRQSTNALPSLNAAAADAGTNIAAVRGESDQPRPSSASIARQMTASPTASQSQPSLDVQTASTATQIARSAADRARQSDTPSMKPDAPAVRQPARTAMRSPIVASPANIESPAMAESVRGVGSPSAEPARMALAKALTGIAGVGQGRNLDRARPAADSPAMVASASARRAESMQNTPAGPDLSPQAPPLERRFSAGAAAPGTSLQADPGAELATTSGAPEPGQLAANASAALKRFDASAAQGPVTATSGTTDVDVGPTMVVSEGQTGRASGGGQPVLNFATDAPRLARSTTTGGTPLAAVTATPVVDAPTSPAATGGGEPLVSQPDVQPTSVARTDPGAAAPTSGGPAMAAEAGPPTEISQAKEALESALARAELAEAAPGDVEAGGGEDEEEKERRRLARARSAALAATETTAEEAAVSGVPAAESQETPTAGGTAVARAEATGDVVGAAGQPSDQPVATEIAASAIGSSVAGRAEVAEDTPVGPVMAAAGGAPARSASRASMPMATEVPIAGQASAPAETAPSEQLAASANAAASRSAQAATSAALAGGPRGTGPEISTAAAVELNATGRAGRNDGPSAPNAAAPSHFARSTSSHEAVAIAPADVIAASIPTAAPAHGAAGTGPDMAAAATGVARASPDQSFAVSAGPQQENLPTTSEALRDSPALARAGSSEAAPGRPTAGGGDPDVDTAAAPSLQRTRRVGEAAGLAGPVSAVAASPAAVSAAGGGPSAERDASPLATATVRMSSGESAAGEQRTDTVAAAPAGGATGGDLVAEAEYRRAEAVEGVIGAPEIGGGTARPSRAAVGPTIAAATHADMVALAGAPESGGVTDGTPIAAQGNEAGKLPGGRLAPPAYGPVDASPGDMTIDVAMSGRPGVAADARPSSPSTQDGPSLGQLTNAGAPLRRSSRTALPSGATEVAMIDTPSGGSTAATDADQTLQGISDVEVARRAAEGGLAVYVDAVDGPGGLGAEYTVEVGLNDRRATRESMQLQMRPTRFVRQHVGGLPEVSTAATVPAEAFRRRADRVPGQGTGDGLGSPPPATEESVERGLAFLARHQLPDGSWSLQGINGEPAALVTDTGATALALLAFQGAGYNHREHRYAELVRAGLDYLVKNQEEDGDLYVPLDEESNRSVWLYSHALATLALCEAYGMTQDPSLREPAQKAINFIVASQQPERGGWRYSPQYGADTSVTGWMMMALKSGESANLQVPPESLTKIRNWLDRAQASSGEPHLYAYNPFAPDTDEQRHGRKPSMTMTSVGLLMRLYLGWKRDNAHMVKGADYLAEHLPKIGSIRTPERDTYYWYYATQVMFHMGGEYWKTWNDQLHPLLVNSQIKQGALAGSWDPRNPVPDRWAPHAGRLYVTTMNLLSLEVYYRHLPLYEDTLK